MLAHLELHSTLKQVTSEVGAKWISVLFAQVVLKRIIRPLSIKNMVETV
jgi:hypothetical protein